jgi:anti-sigma factor RsiW
MNHERFQELVNLYIDEELDDAQSVELFAHLSTCDNCRNIMRSSLRVRTYFQQEELEEAPASLDARVYASTRKKTATPVRRNPFSPLWYTRILIPLPAAASIAILILIGSLLFSPLLFEKPKQFRGNEIEMISNMPQEIQQQMQFFR